MSEEELGKELGTVGDTASRDARAADENASAAVDNAIRSGSAIAELRAAIGISKQLHVENHYVPRLRLIFQRAR